MKCPNCGNELKEGHLICEICGEEIQIVPDFEPEIENRMTETLSTLAAMQEQEKAGKAKEEEPSFEREPESDSMPMRKIWILTVLVLLFAAAAGAYGIYAYHTQTVEYKIDQARACAEKEDYTAAIAYLEEAYQKDAALAEILFMEADYYYLQQDNENAARVLLQIIGAGSYTPEEVEEAYDKLVAVYAAQENYAQINELLLSCPDTKITSRFQSYMAMPPEFNYAEGSYEEVVPLKLSSNTAGTIYYTLDGTEPDEQSQIYTSPIFLETGKYQISAFFVNDYGIASDIVTRQYSINLLVPNAPEVALYSGEYTEPTMIEVQPTENCKLYYTTDETEPTSDSVPYTGPIPMPMGKTVFKFVNISEEGVSSDVTMRTYTLTLENAIPTSQAVSSLITHLVETGYLLDIAGHTKDQPGTLSYQFSSVIRVQGEMDYFTIYEYYDDGTGVKNRTDKVFLVDVHSGAVARLGYDENGEYTANPI